MTNMTNMMKWIPIIAGLVMFIGLVLMVVAVMIARSRKGAGGSPAKPKPAPQRGMVPPPQQPQRQGAMPPPPPPPPPGSAAAFSPPPPPAPWAATPSAEPAAEPTVTMDMSGMTPPVDGRTVVVAPAPKFGGMLVGTHGALLGREVTIDEDGFIIGRDQAMAQLVITDPRVSKKHVWVGLRNGEVWVVDKGSTNGTYLNKTGTPRINEAMLNEGDTIIISEDVARFQYRKG